MPTLAQVTLDTMPSFVWWVVGGSVAIFLINQVLEFYKAHIKERPVPADTYATKQQVDEELGRERGARKKIHEEMKEIEKSITGLRTETDNQSKDITEIKNDIKKANERIDAVPGRTISLLRETKGLI